MNKEVLIGVGSMVRGDQNYFLQCLSKTVMVAQQPWGNHMISVMREKYSQTSNISCTLVGNRIVDHSDVVGALPVGAAPTTTSFLTLHLTSIDCTQTTARRDENYLSFGIRCNLYYRFDG